MYLQIPLDWLMIFLNIVERETDIFLQMLDRDKGSRLSQFVIGLLRYIGVYLEGFRCIFTQNGDLKVHAGIQNNIILIINCGILIIC